MCDVKYCYHSIYVPAAHRVSLVDYFFTLALPWYSFSFYTLNKGTVVTRLGQVCIRHKRINHNKTIIAIIVLTSELYLSSSEVCK